MTPGILIAFEGIDGTGKSTQVKMLAQRLAALGFDVIATREPTDGQFGRKIREVFVNRNEITPEEELELFIKDRREHVKELIEPALAAGKIVLTDRYYLSTAAYQGAAGQDPEMIMQKNKFAPRPDLVLLIKLSPAIGIHRIQTMRNEELNDFEQEESLKKVDEIFDTMNHDYIKRIDGSGSSESVHRLIFDAVMQLLADKGLKVIA